MTETETVTIIPAQPGWSLAIFYEAGKWDGEPYDASFGELEHVIAWEIHRTPFQSGDGAFRQVIPITVDATDSQRYSEQGIQWVLRQPDGVYIAQGDCKLGSEAEALAWCAKWFEYDRQRKQKTAARQNLQTA